MELAHISFRSKKKKNCLENMLPLTFHSKNKLTLLSKSAHMTAGVSLVQGEPHEACVCLLSQVNTLSGLGHTEPVTTVHRDCVCVVSLCQKAKMTKNM